MEHKPQGNFSPFQRKMEEAGVSAAAIAAFHRSYAILASGETGLMPESTIEPVTVLPRAAEVTKPVSPERARELLARTCVLKLNGGLGTSMGLEKAKSLLKVKEGLTFLDLICRQVLRRRGEGSLAFLLMDSFTTSADTRAFIARHYPQLCEHGDWAEIELMQNKVPKVHAATLAPVLFPGDRELEWCPPGHGDIYAALATGKLDELLAQGVRTLFVSNADNLGATIDLPILDWFTTSGAPFLMEVTERTAVDKKGGHLCRDREMDRLRLREVAQCPHADLASFQDIARHRFFNTNNLWIDLEALRADLAEHGGSLPLPVIFNPKTLDPRDKKSEKVIQLETAMGAAIETFDGAAALVVPRTRFLPVKTTNDLLGLRSDAYLLTEEATLRLAEGVEEPPLVDLDPAHYKLIDQFEEKCAGGVLSLRHCRSLKVTGAVTFQAGTEIAGVVEIVNGSAAELPLPVGAYADRKIVLG